MRVIVNPNIGCKYPATLDNTLVRSMASVIVAAANNAGGRQFKRLTVNPDRDPNEGTAYGYQSS